MSSAAVVVIGNEILSGKVKDENTPFLITELRDLGVQLCELVTIPDQTEAIASAISRVCVRNDHIFTSGGVGPTHDDVTMEGVAAAFGRPVVRHPRLESLLLDYYQQKNQPLVPANLRMANVPQGAQLLEGAELLWPVVNFRNIYILPGIPEIFRRKFSAIRERFRETPYCLRKLYLRCDEGPIADALRLVAARFPALSLGSYPRV